MADGISTIVTIVVIEAAIGTSRRRMVISGSTNGSRNHCRTTADRQDITAVTGLVCHCCRVPMTA